MIERVHAKSTEFLKSSNNAINEDVGFDVLKNNKTFLTLSKKKRDSACEIYKNELKNCSKKYANELKVLAGATLSKSMMDEIEGRTSTGSKKQDKVADELFSAFPTLNVAVSSSMKKENNSGGQVSERSGQASE